MRLSRRLTISLTFLTLTTLAVSFGLTYVFVSREQIRDLDAALRTEAGVVSALLWQDPAIVSTLNSGHYPVADPLKNVQSYVIAYDAEGHPLSWTHDSIPNPPSFSEFSVRSPLPPEGYTFDYSMLHRPLRCIALPITAGPARRLFVGVSRAGVEDDINYLLKIFATLMALAVLSTIAVASWVGTRVASGVRRVADVARVVATGNLAARVEARNLGSTEVKSLASDLNHMISKLDELVSAHKVFASYAAHELRSPLAAMRGELQLALRRSRSSEEYEQVLVSTLEEVEGLVNLAEDLLTLARVQGSAATNEAARVVAFVQEAVRVVAGVAQMRSIEISVTPVSESLSVSGRLLDLARVLRNILENAVAHSPEGSCVRVEVVADAQKVSIALTDEGPGIAPEDLAHIFQPFFRGAGGKSHNVGGAGLGLAIARGIVEVQGGSLRIDPEYTGGARFIVELPRVWPEPLESVATASPDPNAPLHHALHQPRPL
jgi:two-component system heavy metal sensor histidine kinase CusS